MAENEIKSFADVIKETIEQGTLVDYMPTVIPNDVEPVSYLMDKALKEFNAH